MSKHKFVKLWSDSFDRKTIGHEWIPQVLSGAQAGNQELQYYTDSTHNAFIKNKQLVIKVIKQKTPYLGYQYTSAQLVTKRTFQYGFVSVKAKIPKGKGLWPAIWMLPLRYNPLMQNTADRLVVGNQYGVWAACGEIDIMETINSTSMDPNFYTTLHFGGEFPDNRQYPSPPLNRHGPIDWSKFHVFSVEKTPDYIAWYLDSHIHHGKITNGQLLQKVTKDQWFTSQKVTNIVGASPAPFDEYFNLIVNVAVGGNFPCNNGGYPPDEAILPAEMVVDWVKTYQLVDD